jgi:hypothetical protein
MKMIAIDKAKYAEIGRRVRALPPEKSNPDYKWEELVRKMCESNDERLREIGKYELSVLREKFPHSILFKTK